MVAMALSPTALTLLPTLFTPSFKPLSILTQSKSSAYRFHYNFHIHCPYVQKYLSCHALPSDWDSYADPAGEDPPEAEDPNQQNINKYQPLKKEASRMKRKQDSENEVKKGVFQNALFNGEEAEAENVQGFRLNGVNGIPKAGGMGKSREEGKGKEGGNTSKVKDVSAGSLKAESDIVNGTASRLKGEDKISEESTNADQNEGSKQSGEFELDLSRLVPEEEPLQEPSFAMSLSELLDEAKVTPISVEGDVDVVISGIQHDSRQVSFGDMFVCCSGTSVDGHSFAAEAAERGALVIVASKEVYVGENVKALVMVKDTNAILSALAAAFYQHPSEKIPVVGITGTNGKTTTSYLLRSMYQAMGLRTGLLGTIAYYLDSKHKLEAPNTTPDAVYLQKLMATMAHNGVEVCVMEVSSHALQLGRCTEVDFDVAVFTNLSRDHMDFHKSEDEYKEVKGKLFTKMVDPNRHRKVVNLDDPNAGYFASLGNPDVPVVTFGMENSTADVFPLEIQLSLFETELLIRTPQGNIEISSGLLGRHNVYNILAAVAVGIAVEAPLVDIVRGIEEVDAVPGRVELVDEEQAFAVIVDYAHTPDALARLLDTVRECGPRRIITVIGCGGDRDRGKRPMMAKIAAEKSEVSIFTSDNPRTEDPLEIIDDMLAGVGWSLEEYLEYGEKNYYPPIWNGHKVYVHDLRSIAVRAAVAMGEEGDAVVVAGKGHEKYQIMGKEKKYFDDREECREALMHVDTLHAAGVDTSEIPWRFPGRPSV